MSRREQTAAPQRNFTLPTEERVRALVGGPPAFVRRLRAIEDLEERIVQALIDDAGAAVTRDLERLDELVRRHNRYYPVEAELAMHPRTGEMLDRTGKPWRPMQPRTLRELVAIAEQRTGRPA